MFLRVVVVRVSGKITGVGQDAHFCHNLFSISLGHPLKVEFLAGEYLREGP